MKIRTQRTGAVIAALLLLVGATVAVVLWNRPAIPRWTAAPVPVPPLAAALDANVRRLLAHEESELAAAAARAARVPELADALARGIGDAALQDLLPNAAWWSGFRTFGYAVLVGDKVKAAREMPAIGVLPPEIASAVQPQMTDATAGAGLVSGPGGTVMAGVARISGAQARVVLARLVDRQMVAHLAMRANIILLLTDGQRDLGTSLPDGTMPEVERLIGHENSHVLVDKGLKRLAVAVPWTKGLWLWVVSGWDP